jgi:hypothetical protein
MKKIVKTILFTIGASIVIWIFMKCLTESFTDKIEVQTVRGSSPEVKNLMGDMNGIGNQLLEDSKYDKVDERVLNGRKPT